MTLDRLQQAEPEDASKPESPYHIFTKTQKWTLITIIGVAGLFSGLSSNIYFPALDQIAQDLQVGLTTISLTITSYMIFQGISPLIWGSLSDALGRRPIYVASFLVYIAANIALSFSPNFVVLLVFRGLQAAGSASTVSIGNGIIQDISPAGERGSFISFYQAIRNFSIAVGPVLGGILSQQFGFRAAFVFLLILSAVVLTCIILFLPETLRAIAGNGSIPVTAVYQPLICQCRKGRSPTTADDFHHCQPRKRRKVTAMTLIEPLRLLGQPEIMLNLLYGGVVYAIWSMMTSSTTMLFKDVFDLSELQLGLAFLPNGLGTVFGSTLIANLLTRSFTRYVSRYKILHSLPTTYTITSPIPSSFPLERARLRHLSWISVLFILATASYGFSLGFSTLTPRPGWICVPLLLQFLITNAVFAINQTLVTDLSPGKGASATAVNNLVRCSMGAFGVAFADGMIKKLGVAAAFLGLALCVVVASPLAVVGWFWGMGWRATREREELKR
ncbi:major facilitator superfamily domain-containing protein [Cladorrhinum sp. PSN332]|nr:major facilitator superfamily domain-containing protein [Cladorrhinum sp. PSN332]